MKQKTQEIVQYKDPYPQSIFSEFSADLVKGIKKGDKAFSFPAIIQLDMTNNCNLNCVGCWCHSELMGELKFKGDWKQKHLPKNIVLKLIKQAAENGTREIQLSGSGDPMMYPYFMDAVRAIKENGLILHLITNFTLVSKDILKKFVELGVDRITLSLWAGSAETYAKTHPNQTGKTFEKIKENLLYLASLKNNNKLPRIKIYNVISNKNYDNIKDMIDFAFETDVEFIEFQIIDTIEGKSDSLALTEKQKKVILNQFEKIRKRNNHFTLGDDNELEFADFGRLYKEKTLPDGFSIEENGKKLKCPKGFISFTGRTYLDSPTSLKFHFSQGICITCKNNSICYSNEYPFKLEFLRVLGIGSFLRRIKNIKDNKEQQHDINIVDKLPCYIGWTFTRILPNGDVLPCCKAHKKPLGNLHEKSFKDIWYSNNYNEFRLLAKTQKKSHPYFNIINCYKSCDNVGMNLETHITMKQI